MRTYLESMPKTRVGADRVFWEGVFAVTPLVLDGNLFISLHGNPFMSRIILKVQILMTIYSEAKVLSEKSKIN